jgi:hypothetical protein
MCAPRWTDIRVVMPMITIWTGGLTIISLFYLPAFDFARTQVLTWFGAYIIYPLIALGLMWTYRKQNRVHPLDEPVLPAWVRRYLLLQSGVMLVVGLGLLLAPQIMVRLWPWTTGQLMLQLYSMPILSYGIGSLILRRQHAWSEIRLALIAMSIFTGLEFVVSLRYRSFLDGSTISTILWLGWLAITTGMLAVLSWMAYQRNDGSRTRTSSPALALAHRSRIRRPRNRLI